LAQGAWGSGFLLAVAKGGANYASLSAALSYESDPIYLGGVLVLGRLLIPSPPVEDVNEQP